MGCTKCQFSVMLLEDHPDEAEKNQMFITGMKEIIQEWKEKDPDN